MQGTLIHCRCGRHEARHFPGMLLRKTAILFLFTLTGMYYCFGQREQFMDSLKMEILSYSDVRKIYASDSAARKISFFRSPSLDSLHIMLRAVIRKATVRQDDSTRVTFYEMSHPAIAAEGGAAFVNWPAIETELARPVFVTYLRSGKIKYIQTDSAISAAAAGIQKEIVSYLQFVRRPPFKKNRWNAVEENTRGDYMASYRLVSVKKGRTTIEKKIGNYLRTKKSFRNQRVNPDTEIMFVRDKQGENISISVSESETVLFGNDTVSIRASEIALRRIARDRMPGPGVAAMKNLLHAAAYATSHTLSEDLTDEQITILAYRNTLGEDDWNSLLARLMESGSMSKSGKDSLSLKFRALFFLQPAACQEALKLLLTVPPDSASFRLLVYSLSITQTAQTAETLASLAWAKKDHSADALQILPLLATARHPTQKAIVLVRSITEQPKDSASEWVASTALLTLAAMIHNYFPAHPAGARQNAEDLMRILDNEPDTMKRILVMGNLGLPLVFPALQKIIRDEKAAEGTRTAAISALLLVEGKQVDAFLEILAHSPEPAIKKAAGQVTEDRKKMQQGYR